MTAMPPDHDAEAAGWRAELDAALAATGGPLTDDERAAADAALRGEPAPRRVVRVSRAQQAAAAAKLDLDRRLGRPSSDHVRRIAAAKPRPTD